MDKARIPRSGAKRRAPAGSYRDLGTAPQHVCRNGSQLDENRSEDV